MLATDDVAGEPVAISVPCVATWVCCTVVEVGPEDIVEDGVAAVGVGAAEGERETDGVADRERETPVVAAACRCCPNSEPAPNTATTTSAAVPAPSAIRRRAHLAPAAEHREVHGARQHRLLVGEHLPEHPFDQICSLSRSCALVTPPVTSPVTPPVTSPFIDVHQIFPDQLT